MEPELKIPDYLPTPLDDLPADLPELVLALYRRVARGEREVAAERRRAEEEREAERRATSRLLARLAGERFELERLLQRIVPELAAAGREDLGELLRLFARGWDAELARARVEVRDLAGCPVTDELAEVVEVEAAVPDPRVAGAAVRETLRPLVTWEGRVVGPAKVITSVPTAAQEPESGGGSAAGRPPEATEKEE